MATAKRNVKGMGGYKSAQHQKTGGGKQRVDPQNGVGTIKDQYKGK